MSAARQAVGCPLCGSPFVAYDIASNNQEQRGWLGELRGFTPGKPSMTAHCARGCIITAQASQPLPAPPLEAPSNTLPAASVFFDPGPSKYDIDPCEPEHP